MGSNHLTLDNLGMFANSVAGPVPALMASGSNAQQLKGTGPRQALEQA